MHINGTRNFVSMVVPVAVALILLLFVFIICSTDSAWAGFRDRIESQRNEVAALRAKIVDVAEAVYEGNVDKARSNANEAVSMWNALPLDSRADMVTQSYIFFNIFSFFLKSLEIFLTQESDMIPEILKEE